MIYTNIDQLPLSLTVEKLAQVLCIGKNKAYDLVRCKAIRSVRIGNSIRIPKDALIEYLRQ